MSRGRYKFRRTEAQRALVAFGTATGIDPSDVVLSVSRDGTITVSAKESSDDTSETETNPFDVEGERIRGPGEAA